MGINVREIRSEVDAIAGILRDNRREIDSLGIDEALFEEASNLTVNLAAVLEQIQNLSETQQLKIIKEKEFREDLEDLINVVGLISARKLALSYGAITKLSIPGMAKFLKPLPKMKLQKEAPVEFTNFMEITGGEIKRDIIGVRKTNIGKSKAIQLPLHYMIKLKALIDQKRLENLGVVPHLEITIEDSKQQEMASKKSDDEAIMDALQLKTPINSAPKNRTPDDVIADLHRMLEEQEAIEVPNETFGMGRAA